MRESQDSIAERHGISSRTLRNYKTAGVDIYNDAAVKKYMELNSMYDYTENSLLGLDATELKQRKQQADIKDKEAMAEIRSIELKQLQGSIVNIEDVMEANMEIAGKIKVQLKKLIVEIPPKSEGLNAVKISQIIRDHVEEILSILYEDLRLPNDNKTTTD